MERFFIHTDQSNSNEIHEGDVASATQRAIDKLAEACMAKWCKVFYIRPMADTWAKVEDEHEFVAEVLQREEA